MGRIIHGQVIASTSLDRHGERIPREVLIQLFLQLKERGLPPAVKHDLTLSPIARSSNPRLIELNGDELAIVVDLEVLDENEFSRMGGFSIAFLRNTIRFGEDEPVVSILINPQQFDFTESVDHINQAIPRTYTFDVTERVEKAIEIADAIITISLTIASQVALKIAEGFFGAVGERLLDNLKQLRRKDHPDGIKRFHLSLHIPKGSREIRVVLELEAESSNLSEVDLSAIMRELDRLPAEAQRIIGVVATNGTVNLKKVILLDNTTLGINTLLPPRTSKQQPTIRSPNRKPRKRSSPS